MLTRIRNGLLRRKKTVDVLASNTVRGMLGVMRAEGFIQGFDEIEDGRQGVIRVHLKYGPDGEDVITSLDLVSKPSRRIYRKAGEVEQVLGGLGVGIYTTNQGVVSDRQARRLNVGGELLCRVW
ncbi:MAG: 30S ribosomal protein S8 [Planctomycetes bacterium]|nr:30S ribosomal protein S8 [Planctomycetota bacterium]